MINYADCTLTGGRVKIQVLSCLVSVLHIMSHFGQIFQKQLIFWGAMFNFAVGGYFTYCKKVKDHAKEVARLEQEANVCSFDTIRLYQ